LRPRETSQKPAANRSTTLPDARRPTGTDAPLRCDRAHSVFVQFAKCPISTCAIGSVKAVRGASYIQFRQRKLARLAAAVPVYSSISGSRLRPPVLRQMLRKLVFCLGRAVPAGVKPPSAHDLRRNFRLITLLCWWRESTDPGVRPRHKSAFLGSVESTSSVLCLTTTGVRPHAAGRRSDRLATPLSTGNVP
jgi:hypothetical protein